jgi:hypothetical protein
MPQRIRFNRFEGEKLPPGAKLITRPGRWRNPFPVKVKDDPASHAEAKAKYAAWVIEPEQAQYRAEARRELKGCDLACSCKIGLPCHGDVLLEIANDTEPTA